MGRWLGQRKQIKQPLMVKPIARAAVLTGKQQQLRDSRGARIARHLVYVAIVTAVGPDQTMELL
jgi:hypothetical protein